MHLPVRVLMLPCPCACFPCLSMYPLNRALTHLPNRASWRGRVKPTRGGAPPVGEASWASIHRRSSTGRSPSTGRQTLLLQDAVEPIPLVKDEAGASDHAG